MNRILSVIGAVCFAVAVAVGCFADFSAGTLVEIAVAVFGAAALVLGAVRKSKENGSFSWKTVVCIVLACTGGIMCCVGGAAQSLFATISGAVAALVAVVFGVVTSGGVKQ